MTAIAKDTLGMDVFLINSIYRETRPCLSNFGEEKLLRTAWGEGL
jgi:hypothetical protein